MENQQNKIEGWFRGREWKEEARKEFEEFGTLHDFDCPVNDENGQDRCQCVVMDELMEVAEKAVLLALSRQKAEIIEMVDAMACNSSGYNLALKEVMKKLKE